MSALLEVRDLRVCLPAGGGQAAAVDGVSFAVDRGGVLGIAGESGSGKTMTGLALLGLTPPTARVTGSARLGDVELVGLSGRALRDLRGARLAMVFQDPLTSLHPMLTVERQLTEHVRHHERVPRRVARERAAELLDAVRIPDPRRALRAYPHQFSGGMRQRIAIAMALAGRPEVLIADEPTTALDVTVQAGILRLLDRLRREHGLAMIVVTHDLGVLSALADDVAVFYAGRIVERGAREQVLGAPRHPYTRGLLDALPEGGRGGMQPIGGSAPALGEVPSGCPFHPRCPYAEEACPREHPPLAPVDDGRALSCHVDPFADDRVPVARR
ncbi:MAG TPA: ABC transporter ATP-binding protein [Solirubrobacteraceae bacterium]|nr:ABC transporter ATP-binding protein [Solirubrobacteraceae bacterium]